MEKLCEECGKPVDADWKTLCRECYLKKVNPELYSKRYELVDITCRRCGVKFTDEAWKDLCFRCWLLDTEEQKLEELEEREQYDR